MDEPTPNLLTIENLRVQLGERSVLNGINTHLMRGKITALIGLNGSGKTTLLKTILREYPFTGQLRFHCGHDHQQQRPERVGYVPQKLNIDTRLPFTVRDLLGLALQHWPIIWGFSKSCKVGIARCLSRVGGERLIDSPVAKLSGGELQRVLLGLALEPEPELLLLDEPAAGIDFRDQNDFYHLIAQINQVSGVTVLLVSHELSVVAQHAHHVLCLRDGRIHCEGAPHEVLSGEVLTETFGQGKWAYHH